MLHRFIPVLVVFLLVGAIPLHAETPISSVTSKPKESGDNETFKQLSLFADVLERTRADYVEEVSDEKLIESAINGMLVSLDPHSSYLNRKSFAEMQTQTKGEFGGLGLEVTMENGLVKVVSPIDGTPAANAGMQPGDLITHIDGKPVTDLTLAEAVDQMRGPQGTKVTLTVRRGGLVGQPFDLPITRAVIRIQSVRFRAEGNIGYIRITTFNEQTQTGLDKALAELDKTVGDKLIGYVVDLRNDPGGLLEQAVSVAGTFLPKDAEVVSTRGRHTEDSQSYTGKSGDKTGGKPIVVIINGGSASASEIVAGALQDHHRAILIGTKSFGKGSVQTIIPIAGSGAMRLTTARYYTPSGRSIQKLGIEPDILVQQAKLEEINAGKGISEADLKGALANPDSAAPAKPVDPEENSEEDESAKEAKPPKDKDKDGKAKDGKGKDGKGKDGKDKDAAKKEPYDNQLARALDLLRGINLYEQKAKHP